MDVKAALRGALNRPERLTTYRDRHRIASLLSVVPLPLPRVLALFGSDKQQAGGHSYGAVYAGILSRWRYRRLKILEIGVLGGASLLAWRAFFPRAVTVGFDLFDKAAFAAGRRTRCYQGDQGSAEDLDRLSRAEGPFDLIIDDGSHLSRHQIFSFRALFPHLQPGGLYVIEDVQTSFWSEVGGTAWDGRHVADPGFADTCFGWFLDLAKYTNHAEFRTLEGTDAEKMALGAEITEVTFSHNVIVVRKGANVTPSNQNRRAEAA